MLGAFEGRLSIEIADPHQSPEGQTPPSDTHRHVFWDGELVVGLGLQLLVLGLGDVQLPEGPSQLARPVTELAVGLLQLLLPLQYAVHLLLTQGLLFPEQSGERKEAESALASRAEIRRRCRYKHPIG